MPKARICLDLDNVLAKTDEIMRRVIRRFTDGEVDLSYQDVIAFNYCECKDARGNSISREQWQHVHNAFSQPENIRAIEPYPHIQEYLERIVEEFDLHIVTSRLRLARSPTVEWLDRNEFPDHSLHFVPHGEKHSVLGRFVVSVEDDLEQVEAFAGIGTTSYILAHPWNKTSPASKTIRLPDWPALCEHILSK